MRQGPELRGYFATTIVKAECMMAMCDDIVISLAGDKKLPDLSDEIRDAREIIRLARNRMLIWNHDHGCLS